MLSPEYSKQFRRLKSENPNNIRLCFGFPNFQCVIPRQNSNNHPFLIQLQNSYINMNGNYINKYLVYIVEQQTCLIKYGGITNCIS